MSVLQKQVISSQKDLALLDSKSMTDYDKYLFFEGRHSYLYEKLGSHVLRAENGQILGTYFSVWAPNATEVTVIGDFNDWSFDYGLSLKRSSAGIWSGFSPYASGGDLYKIGLKSAHSDHLVWRSDPFSQYFSSPPTQNGVVWESFFRWNDRSWIEKRHRLQSNRSPICIYEMHLGSWRHKHLQYSWQSLSYRELADVLPAYLKNLGFTHVEFLPIMEHPFYGSWGYQCTGYFATTHRYGTPDDFKYLVDALHQSDIGVILDWVPSHFPGDEFGLRQFDGHCLYESDNPRSNFHPDWKSFIFDFSRPEVCSFLISSALFWLREFHVDGLRVDAVASMLYLNYSRSQGEWEPNRFGGYENLEAMDFLRSLNKLINDEFPDCLMIAEESTAWPSVTRKVELGGLGFDMKWDMGWMNDTLKYFSYDPVYRKYHHDELTFRAIYANSENYLLALSHDEVVHEKKSLVEKMPGNLHEKFANVRLLYAYMYSLPGKKLLFMGAEFGQRREWNHDQSLDWHLLDQEFHGSLFKYLKDLNFLYKNSRSLYASDFENTGFLWIDCHDYSQSVISFMRTDPMSGDSLICIFNFTPIARYHYQIGVPKGGPWSIVFNSDSDVYAGTGVDLDYHPHAYPHSLHGFHDALSLTLPPLSALFLRREDENASQIGI